MTTSPQLQIPQRSLAIILFLTIVLLAIIGYFAPGIDYLPLKWGIELELAGKSAYGPEMQALYTASFAAFGTNLAYPLPAIWLALPIAYLPAPYDRII